MAACVNGKRYLNLKRLIRIFPRASPILLKDATKDSSTRMAETRETLTSFNLLRFSHFVHFEPARDYPR